MLPFVSAHPIPSARAFLIMREDLRFARRCMHGERRRNGRPFGRLQEGLCRSAGGDRRPDGPAAAFGCGKGADRGGQRSEEHTSELQSLMRIPYAVFCLKKKNIIHIKKLNTMYHMYHHR